MHMQNIQLQVDGEMVICHTNKSLKQMPHTDKAAAGKPAD